MSLHDWFQPPRRLLTYIVAVIVLPAAALTMLAWRIRRFLSEQGFAVEAENLSSFAGKLSCMRSVPLPPGVVEKILSTHFVFTISDRT